ncbi:cleft lip and palate transmembrane 1 [Auricularia subglabra TFB-10046 SS5]|nr:cleft lip and palate transmembrane 1 [Auricularia subglabra TFB-10046 SS5]
MSQPRDAARPAAAAPQGQRQQEEQSPWNSFLMNAQKVILMYMAVQFISKWMAPKPAPAPPTAVTTDGNVQQAAPGAPNPFDLPPNNVNLGWAMGTPLNMHVYVSTSPYGDVFRSDPSRAQDADLPHFVWENISLGDWNDIRIKKLDVPIPSSVQHNASLWAHTFLCANGSTPDYTSPTYNRKLVTHTRKLLTRYMPKKKVRKEKSLLSSSEKPEPEVEEVDQGSIVSHWHTNLTLGLVSDNTEVPWTRMAPIIQQYITLVPEMRDTTGTRGYYYPIVFPNDFWHLSSQYVEINTTTPVLPLEITLQPITYFKFQMFASFTVGFEDAAKKGSASEIDEIKRMLLETNPYFLALTAIVSILHMVFEMLAFKSDVSHWRKKNELVGVSVRTIVTNVFVQLIILLYLIDNNAETSWMILFGQGTGMLIEAWKITKAVDIRLVAAPASSRLPFALSITDKHVLSEDEKKTQEYDALAFRYVSYVTIPLLAGYTVYSLIYNTHRGWYSFIISTLTSFVYAFGFVQLIPQLIINYKLKSVAHMPMKAMVYKTLSTVVDDLFAFCIKMPFLHRLACFRDDAVFLVFLYQRWIYRIDPTRVNEYGQVLAPLEKDEKGETKKDK